MCNRYEGVMYRGINIDLNPVMKQKYDTYETSFAVGTKITFPAPTSCTTSDHIASDFTNGIQLMIQNQSGVMMVPGHLSAFEEDEVMPPFPSSYKVVARSKVQDTVVVVIAALQSAVTYCSPPASPAPSAAVKSPPAPPAAAAAIISAASAAVAPPATAEDPEIMALSQALKGLDFGSAATCLKFAKALEEQGILTLDKLKKMAPDKVQKVLEKVKMTETQIDTIMEAVAPPPAAAVAAPAAPAPAPKPAAFASPAAAAAAPAVAAPAPAPKAAAVAFNESPSCVATLQGHGSSDVNCVAFHASLPVLATGSDDKTAKLWRLNSDCSAASCVATLQGHGNDVRSVAFHASLPILATGSWDDTAKLWR